MAMLLLKVFIASIVSSERVETRSGTHIYPRSGFILRAGAWIRLSLRSAGMTASYG